MLPPDILQPRAGFRVTFAASIIRQAVMNIEQQAMWEGMLTRQPGYGSHFAQMQIALQLEPPLPGD